jgi:putative hemolysin
MPEKISRLMSFPMYWLSVVTAPFIWLLTKTSDLVIKVLRIKPSTKSKVTEDEIKKIVQEGLDVGAIRDIEQDIVERVFILGDRKVSSLMTHRSDTIVLKSDFEVADIKKVVFKELHSIYPVVDSKMDLEGIVFLKDLFKYLNDTNFKLEAYLKKPQFISSNKSAYEALTLFKNTNTRQAVVLDDFGQMYGIITLNDLLEALVGDVSDFYEQEFAFVQRSENSWLIDGQFPLSEFLHRFNLDHLSLEYPFNTISGLILNELKRFPVTGEIIYWRDFEIEVVDLDKKRIDKLIFTQKN